MLKMQDLFKAQKMKNKKNQIKCTEVHILRGLSTKVMFIPIQTNPTDVTFVLWQDYLYFWIIIKNE